MTRRSAISLAAFLLPAVAFAGATASTFKKENKKGTNYWNAQSAIDGNLETAWRVPGESPNRGEWIMLDVPKSTIDKISIVNGWGMTQETWTDHPRAKKIQIETFCCMGDMQPGATTHADLVDLPEPGWQTVDIDDLEIGNDMGFGGKVKISIVDIYDGKDFPDLGISEISIVLKDYDAAVAPGEASADAENTPLEMLDQNPKTFWATPAEGAFFMLSSPGGQGISTLHFSAGPKDFARPKTVKVIANNREQVTVLPDDKKPHPVMVPSVVGYTGSAWGDIRVEIVDTYPGTRSEVAIAEIAAKATNSEGL